MWPDRGMSLSLGEAEQYFNEAAAKNARIGAWPYLVRTRRACAGMLLDRDAPEDCARAVKLIEEGSADADHLGMRRELDRFDRLRRRMNVSSVQRTAAEPRLSR
jgi:hypothetical protein